MLRASPQEQPSASTPPVIRQMIDQAQHELARGNAAAAADLFEQAAEHGEYAEAEVGEVRARLWAGQFRHAVAISRDSCLVKAGRICGARGYDIIESDKYDRTLLIGCKAPATATATR